jgi:nicotinic acid phosphoribosyltransferase
MPKTGSALLTDLYQLNMMAAYLEHGLTDTAVFELFVRNLPPRRGFLVAAGLEQALQFLETVAFTPEEVAAVRGLGQLSDDFSNYLLSFRFTGDVDAVPEGTVFFPDEPILRVTAPLPEAQSVETRLINLLHFQTVIASKAARMVLAAPGKALIDYGLRRAHGAEAGLFAARAAYLAGFTGTATIAAGIAFGIPVYGTMAHSFIQAYDDETLAFEHFACSHPQGLVLLISLTTAADAPALDCAYKLQEYAGRPRRKRSEGKATWPGRKQVWRRRDVHGRLAGDIVSLAEDHQGGQALLRPIMRGGRRLPDLPDLTTIRHYAQDELAQLPEPLARLEPFHYTVEISAKLRRLSADLDRRFGQDA